MRYFYTTTLMATILAWLAGGSAPAVYAQDAAAVIPLSMSKEPAIYMRAQGYDYDHEILVALPASYHSSPDKKYPVLWTMDGAKPGMA